MAIFKFNSGMGAILCSKCSAIIKTGSDFTDEEWKAMKGEIKIPNQYCETCMQEMQTRETNDRLL